MCVANEQGRFPRIHNRTLYYELYTYYIHNTVLYVLTFVSPEKELLYETKREITRALNLNRKSLKNVDANYARTTLEFNKAHDGG